MSPVEYFHYPNTIPEYAERELARLHAGRYSSLPHFEIYGLTRQASTYVARRDNQATTMLMYRRQGPLVRVLNEGIPLTLDEAQRFAACMFERDDAPSAVLFRAVEMDVGRGNILIQQASCEQDSILALPASKADYLASLGPRTRSLLSNRLNKLKREHPSFAFHVSERGQIDPQHVHTILALHNARLDRRRDAIHIDAGEEDRVLQMMARCGMMGVLTIDGRCCAGSICYRNGDVVSARFLAHDRAYDVYRLGFLCAYLMCSACTERDDIRQFNFGWGNEAYKARLGGKPRALSDVVIYRNKTQRLRLAPLGVKLMLRSACFRLRRWGHFLKA